MNKKNIFEILKKSDYYKVSYTNVEEIVNGEFVKKLRRKLDMSQNVFATVLGITKKTIEKWEQGANPIKGCSARLLFLIDKNVDLIKEFYCFEYVKNEIESFVVDNSLNMENVFIMDSPELLVKQENSSSVKDHGNSSLNEKNNKIIFCC